MSTESAVMEAAPSAELPKDRLLTWADLEARWQPPMEDAVMRRQWLRRRAQSWGLLPMRGTRGDGARFHWDDVAKAEQIGRGRRGR